MALRRAYLALAQPDHLHELLRRSGSSLARPDKLHELLRRPGSAIAQPLLRPYLGLA